MRSKIDVCVVRGRSLIIFGWAFGRDPETRVHFKITDGKGKKVKGAKFGTVRRDEVADAYFPDYARTHGHSVQREMGFGIEVPYDMGLGEERILWMKVDGRVRKIKLNDRVIRDMNSRKARRREKLLALLHWETVEVAFDVLREEGLKTLWNKTINKLKGVDDEYNYGEWFDTVRSSDEELKAQRKIRFNPETKFAIVIPVYKTPEIFLRKMLLSIRKQTYGNFKVYMADATEYDSLSWSEEDGKLPKDVLKEFSKKDGRFRYTILNKNLGISDNTNEAIRLIDEDSDFVVFCDHDDELCPDALFEFAKVIKDHPEVKLIYSDEDKIDFVSSYLFEPHLKTDYNPDLLRSVNYICHLLAISRPLLEEIAEVDENGEKVYERRAYDGAQDYDLILRACEKAEYLDRVEDKSSGDKELISKARYTSSHIMHIPKVLYHWRFHQLSTSANPETKLYAFKAGERAIYDHAKRIGLPILRVEQGITYGFYHPIYEIEIDPSTGSDPLISVIIPNKDHSEDLNKAIRSLLSGDYKNFEFIIVENNSVLPETFKYYDEIQKELKQVKVIRWEREFNYSAINNFGVSFAKGEYLLLMNNDIELIAKNSVREMLMYVQRSDVGVCGARLLYPDKVIQHAGVVIGFGGIAGAAFVGIDNKELTYMHRAKCIQDYSAVTAACLLTKKSVYEEAGGFSEELAVAFNDVDFCLKVRSLDKKVVYNPYALFYHYESKSRGLEDTPEKVERFNSEIVKLAKRWPEILRKGDPYYHPGLTLMKSNFTLRDLSKEKPGKPFPMDILKGIV